MNMQQRSTKGASRQRRELINSEIMKIRDLLPVPENVRSHLSQLQVMSLCNTYVAKCRFFESAISMQGYLFEDLTSFVNPQYPDHSELFPGFLTMVTLDGKVLYLSENVIEYLGHSMVDVLTNIDTFYDLIDSKDHGMVKDVLVGMKSGAHSQDEWSFTCRMGVTKKFQQNFGFYDQKSMIVRGFFTTSRYSREFTKPPPVFVALCTPRLKMGIASEPGILFDTMIFESLHELDMKFLDISSNGELHLGYSKDEIQFRSLYEFIHPDDSSRSVAVHKNMLYRDSCSWNPLCVRVQTKDGHLMWISLLMKKVKNINAEGREGIYCVNQIVRAQDVANEFEGGLMKTSFGQEVLSSTTTGLSEGFCFTSSGTKSGFSERKCSSSSSREEVIQKLKRKVEINEMKRMKKAFLANDNVPRSRSLSSENSSALVFDFSPKKIAAFKSGGMRFQKNTETGSVEIEYSPRVRREDGSSCSSVGSSVFKHGSPSTPASDLSSPNSCELSITCPRDDAFDCITSLPTPEFGKSGKYRDQDVFESGNQEEDFAIIVEEILNGSSFHDNSGKDLQFEKEKRVGDLPILCPGTIDEYFQEFEAPSFPGALENVFEMEDCYFASVGVNCALPVGQTLLDHSPASSGRKMEKFWPEVSTQLYSLGLRHGDCGYAAFSHSLDYADDAFQPPSDYPWNGFSDFLMAG